ncbi:MAG: PilZ domain-containing protein [Rudaea sp.]
MSQAEKRRHPRLSIYSAALAVSNGEGYLSDVKDLSQSGACIGRPKNWPASAPAACRLFFIFDQETVIGIDARIMRTTDEEIGVEFTPDQNERIESLLYESRFLDRDVL